MKRIDIPPREDKPKSSRWKKGQSGNPNGRPKQGESATFLIREIGKHRRDMKLAGKPVDVSYLEGIMYRLYALADRGNIPAIKLILAYHDGLPIQRTELTGAEGKPFMYNPDLDGIK